MTEAQRLALKELCDRYKVEFREGDYHPSFDLPVGYVAGWIGGWHGSSVTIYVGCSSDGQISS